MSALPKFCSLAVGVWLLAPKASSDVAQLCNLGSSCCEEN